ncbi:glycosyltransferase family 2 protein [Isoptericola sp. b441]|uniref:Glycosyltransferase family 2 protein n=1 Tax=Actinotalea lenta TaxID=3064654 RepID=A0ABT9D815_9CELL|nr:glycosyltransferase family 2 protein [Isoptericola sp. b441]MDO8107017.1 glycosyltransferase family 2 protein [Isoptericola sp. b441]
MAVREHAPAGQAHTPRPAGRPAPDAAPRRRRRQWGAERPRPPLPAAEPPAAPRATWLGGLAIAATVAAWATYLGATVAAQFIDHGVRDARFIAETAAYVLVMTLLLFSSVMYLVARQGALYRSRDHVRVPRAEIDAHFGATRPSLTVLVPSYAEEPDVVRTTLLSTALQEYPGLRIVLLLDDPPEPSDPEAAASLAGCRDLPREIMDLLAEPYERFSGSLVTYEAAAVQGGPSDPDSLRSLAIDYAWAARWLRDLAAEQPRDSHVDDFLADQVLGALAGDLEVTSRALFAARDEGASVPAERLAQLSRRLVWTFGAEVSSFERKRYVNLPHDANKAMNLNAYLGLMGRTVLESQTRIGRVLRPSESPDATLVPDSDYVLTLDADSILLREYCLRLIHQMELPGNERVAVIQTPYSAFRGASTRLERIAGATTDVQHIVHQGLTHFDATFWVGANAVIRKPALEDIVEVSYVRGQEVRRYVQDRTVIEDTESSIDLVANGWSLVNYPERLSYSATPPDFGALVVQRARWANGGLLIAPKFWRHARQARKEGRRLRRSTVALRTTYMASISWASLGLVFLLVFPFNSTLLSPILVLAALPYFLAMGADFHRLGYKRTDVLRVYAFNLVLLAVNLGGTLKSLQQAAAKSKIPFARTPKVADRTAAPATYVLAAVLIAAFSFYTLATAWVAGSWWHAAFAAFNGVLTTYGVVAFIGVRNAVVDVVLGAVHWVRVPAEPPGSSRVDRAGPEPDWEAVLYVGPDAHDVAPRTAVSELAPARRGDTRARQR